VKIPANGRAGIAGGHGDLGDLVDGGTHRRIIQVIGADEVVLNVNAVDGDRGEGTAQPLMAVRSVPAYTPAWVAKKLDTWRSSTGRF